MADDAELLSEFCRNRSEAAFSELVGRYLRLVYSAALRHAEGDQALAQDVSQQVFIALARKAPELAQRTSVAGWLFVCTRHLASRARRGEIRRRHREQAAFEAGDAVPVRQPAEDPVAASAALDQALSKVGERDRELLLMRYFRSLSYQEIGERAGLSADAARFRVDRALERARRWLERQGVRSSSAAIATALAVEAQAAVPAALGSSVIGAALATAPGGAGLGLGVLQLLMNSIPSKIATAVAVSLLVAAAVVDIGRARQLNELAQVRSDLANERQHLLSTVPPGTANRVGSAPMAHPPGALKADDGAGGGTGLTDIASLTNAGMGSPFATLETTIWARSHGSADTLAKLIKFSDEAQAQMDALWKSLPPESTRAWSSEEAMMGEYLSQYRLLSFAGYRVVGDHQNGPTPDLWVIEYELQSSGGKTTSASMPLQQVDGGWKMMIGPGSVKRLESWARSGNPKGVIQTP